MIESNPHDCGVDDIAPASLVLRQFMFSVLATLNEQKWSTLGECRGQCEGARGGEYGKNAVLIGVGNPPGFWRAG